MEELNTLFSKQKIEQLEPDEAAEDSLVALMVKDADWREKIVDTLRLEMFGTEVPHAVFSAVCDLMVEDLVIDDVTLTDSLRKHVKQPEVTLNLIKSHAVSPGNVDHYITRVRESYEKRRIFHLCGEMRSLLCTSKEDFEKLQAEFEDEVLQEIAVQDRESDHFLEAAGLAEQAKLDGGLGYSWGLPRLDRATRGIMTGKYYAIGGLKKTGKTLFGVQTIAELAGKQKIPCLVFSLEMSRLALDWSFLSRETRIDSALFGTDRITNQQLHSIKEKAPELDDWPLYIDSRKGLTVEQIISSIRRHVRKGVKVILIDYLQRIEIPNKTDNRATAIQKAINKIADAAAKYDVAILVLSQLANRAEQGGGPTVGDFKESGGIT